MMQLKKERSMTLSKISKTNNFLFVNQKKNLFCLLIVSLSFLIDRFTKNKIIDLHLNQNQVYINDMINLDLVWNTGIGFGLFSSNSTLIYNTFTTAIGGIILFLIYLITRSQFIDKILFSLILGGALGNFYDRIVYFAVPDFIDMHYENFHWFTFNFADIFISIGIICLISKDIFFKK